MGGVFGDSVHHVAYQTRCNCVEIGVKGAGGCMWSLLERRWQLHTIRWH